MNHPSPKRFSTFSLASLCMLGALSAAPALAGARVESPVINPVDAGVYTQLERSPSTPVWVYLKDEADLSRADTLATKVEKARFVYQTLKGVADRSQAPLKAELTRRGVEFQSYYLVNALLVHADKALVSELARRGEVRRIAPNPTMYMLADRPNAYPTTGRLEATTGIEWNVTKIGAPQVWAAGYKGKGVVVAGNDTGVQWNHPAIIKQYRGSATSVVSHDYNWFDAIKGQATPYDDHGHGTFTVGEMVGDDGKGNQIGAAPDAQWIGCKNMNSAGYGSPAAYVACFQFFIAPTDSAGLNPRPDLAPDVVNNSWTCPKEEGCDANTLHDIVNKVQSAGVMLVFAAGNSGPSCSTVMDPPATYPEMLSVGATDSSDNIASFSSRGPSTFDKGLKPNVSAPGVGVRSCNNNGGYTSMSGTSMASPMTVGAIALLWSARPSLLGDINGTSTLLENTATRKLAPKCGGDSGNRINNVFGYGLLNAKAALDKAPATP